MVVGSKGVGATVANDEFFQRRQAAAVLKHGVVRRYSTIFTTMTSTHSSGRRVVYLDGYAGRGGYEDGTPGSPLLALETARAVAGWDRHVESVFVEADRASYLELTKRLQEAATGGAQWRVRHGDVVEHLDETLELARGLPLLAFLDPFGTALPFDALVERILNRHETAPTEVLLNLNIDLVRRWGGLLDLETRNIGQETILARLDRFFGDSWWRDVYLDTRGGDSALAASQAALAVVDTFHERIRARTGHGAFCVPIRRKPHHLPLFILVLFHRHPVAPWKFNEAASLANADWRAACRSEALAQEGPPLPGQLSLLDLATLPDEQAAVEEGRLEREWLAEISNNLRALAADGRSVPLVNRISEIYGRTLGQARDKHIRRAWDTLAKDGIVRPRASGVRVHQDTLVPHQSR
ncbi:three-Cys-motif partner protein TcmP [Frankia sp. AgB32]|uniref:three-Cys-motif partner protein TcmP n=1 Tax=Frankia sp. AgB32 TaxID=631119 RepID=UPI00200FDC6C|nr:three-Cys-motif partner protein TcmP [Frankia sp. AgB32]MCK9895650.1 three-Cys-motif partner protein TcmP [Frankia sp. AgB32]